MPQIDSSIGFTQVQVEEIFSAKAVLKKLAAVNDGSRNSIAAPLEADSLALGH